MVTLCLSAGPSFAQEKTAIYNPLANAETDIKNAVKLAAKENKQVLIQVGGNWCSWCTRFQNTVKNSDTLRQLMDDNYVMIHLNYSPENKNEASLARLGYPQRFGFPVFIILDGKGQRIHTQNSAYLEEGKGYDKKKIAEFLEQWSTHAIDPATYKNTIDKK